MTVSKTFVATAAVTLIVGVATAQAQHRGGGGQSRGGGGQSRGSGGGQRAVARAPSAPRSGGAPRAVAPRSYANGPSRSGASRSGPPRVYDSARAGAGASRSYAYAGSRGYSGYRGGSRSDVVVSRTSPRFYGGGRYVNVRPVRFYRPYYTFRPRISLGFGLWAGFPIAYPSYYGYYDPYYDPYGYPYPVTGYPAYPPAAYPPSAYPPTAYPPTAYPPTVYPPTAYPRSGYPPSGSVAAQGPNQGNTGGVSFEMTPDTAEVFVDGEYVGAVSQFTPSSPPLSLTPGRHHIEIRAAGYRTLDLDADIVAGQVIPYQGTLQR